MILVPWFFYCKSCDHYIDGWTVPITKDECPRCLRPALFLQDLKTALQHRLIRALKRIEEQKQLRRITLVLKKNAGYDAVQDARLIGSPLWEIEDQRRARENLTEEERAELEQLYGD